MNLFISNNRKDDFTITLTLQLPTFYQSFTYKSLLSKTNTNKQSYLFGEQSYSQEREYNYYKLYQIAQQIMLNKEERIFEPALFRQYLRSKLISLLDSIAGRKLLMLDQDVRTPINLVIQKKILSEHGVPEQDGIKAFDSTILPNNYDQIMIFLKPSGQNLKILKDLIEMNKDKGNKKYYPCFWPKRTIICKQFFQQNLLSQFVDIRDFSFDLLPLDVDLYSLQMKFLKELYINHDHSIFSTVAESIHRLQCVFGKVHNIYGKGKAAKAVFQILRLKENEIKIDENFGDIESIIIIDRSVDFLTPLLKQTVYEGIIDQIYGIKGGIVRIPSSKYQQDKVKEKGNVDAYKQLKLNSEKDYIYEQIRGLSLFGARSLLKVRGAQFDEFQLQAGRMRDLNDKSAAMKRITMQKQFLKNHLTLMAILQQDIKTIRFNKQLMLQQACLQESESEIVEYFQNMIPFDIPVEYIIKNMSIQSIISKGIHRKVYSKICEDICLSHGMKHIVSLTHLANLGFFYEAGTIKDPYPYAEIKKQLKLISDAPIDQANPQDTSFAYGGYIPVAAKLVQNAIRNGWRVIQKALRIMPGDTIMPQFAKICQSHPRPAVVVYFVGGVTYGQIATIRLLGKFLKREIIIATTQIINGDDMIRQLLQ